MLITWNTVHVAIVELSRPTLSLLKGSVGGWISKDKPFDL